MIFFVFCIVLVVSLLLVLLVLIGCGKDILADVVLGYGEFGYEEGEDDYDVLESIMIMVVMVGQVGICVVFVVVGIIVDEYDVQGLLIFVDGCVVQVMVCFFGLICLLCVNVGDCVVVGQVLVSIESNFSLIIYIVSVLIVGVVLVCQVQVGGVVGEGMLLFEIGDLFMLWVDLYIFGNDIQYIIVGVLVMVLCMIDGVSQVIMFECVLFGIVIVS